MLSRLSIVNYALIKSLEMEPDKALNIITGETGAGKSIMLGAVGLLLGNRADTKVLYDDKEKCIIEGEFHIGDYNLTAIFEENDLDYDNQTVIRREITPAGKSRAFVNDTPVNLDILKELGNQLMDVHSQNETLLLGKANFQLKLIDAYSGSGNLLSEYRQHFAAYRQAAEQLRNLQENADRLSQESDYNNFLLNELTEANLQEDEQQGLEEELKLLENAEEIKQNLNQALTLLDRGEPNISQMLQEVRHLSDQLSNYSEVLGSLATRINESFIELSDIHREIERQEGLLEVDFGRADEVRERISMLYHLQNKHHVDDIKGLIAIREKLEKETFIANNLEVEIKKAKDNLDQAEKQMNTSGQKLSTNRSAAFENLCNELSGLLQQVGMPDARVEIAREEKVPGESGLDDIIIMFSANKGIATAPLSKVASGGEFSRLMFCIKYILADKSALPTMVFDEIDSGISGEVALQMGSMIQEMANNHQVITISHLAQIAARGQAHYFVYKENEADRSVSKIKRLSDQEKVEEVAKMISGAKPTESAYTNARELIALSY
jgi:DNA repair protein RecN (Recombination protein N)